jgi:hypothetical protein
MQAAFDAGLGFRLLNEFQREFPLAPAPYAVVAGRLGTTPARVIEALAQFRDQGVLGRVGAVFAPNVVGASTLAAMDVPADRLAQVAAIVSARAEVNHNYEREASPTSGSSSPPKATRPWPGPPGTFRRRRVAPSCCSRWSRSTASIWGSPWTGCLAASRAPPCLRCRAQCFRRPTGG